MICPYCGAEMEKGVIHRDRYKLKWVPYNKDKGPILQFFADGVNLENNGDLVEAYYCETDRIVLIKV